jgi:hypothetical protein
MLRACRRTASRTPRRERIAHLPPVSILFAAFLGYNPIQHLLGPHAVAALSPHDQAVLVGHSFFPDLISGRSATACTRRSRSRSRPAWVAAAASLARGGVPGRADQPAPGARAGERGPRARSASRGSR